MNSYKKLENDENSPVDDIPQEEEKTSDLDKYPTDTFKERLKMMMALIVPAVLANLTQMFGELVNLKMIGQLEQPILLDAVGLGNMTINLCANSIIMGFSSALDTVIA